MTNINQTKKTSANPPGVYFPRFTLPTRLLGAVAATTAAFQSAWKMCKLLDVLMLSIYVFLVSISPTTSYSVRSISRKICYMMLYVNINKPVWL